MAKPTDSEVPVTPPVPDQPPAPAPAPDDAPAARAVSTMTLRVVQVLYGYRGEPSQENFIAPGFYNAGDPQLYGLADYLIANGHAIEAGPRG